MAERKEKEIRVLHSVGTFLNLSENWIYPQIFSVPRVTGRVLCRKVSNADSFDFEPSQLITERTGSKRLTARRMFDAAARRVGLRNASMNLRIRRFGPAIMHAHFGTRAWESIPLCKRSGIPLVTSFYGFDAWQLPKSDPAWLDRYKELFEFGSVFLVEGNAMRERLIELGCPEEKVRIQHIGVDVSELPFSEPDLSNGLRIAMVGRFVEKKGLEDGLRACALARSKGVDLRVTIIGDGNDESGQKIKTELHSIANTPELNGLVTFAGFIPLNELHSILKEHNVFMCPSRHAENGDAEGGSPVVLTEAMALGLLCIGTRHCDIPELIEHGETGLLGNEHDVEGIAELLVTASRNESQLKKMINNGRRHVAEQFSLSMQLEKASAIYEQLLSDTGKIRQLDGHRSAIAETAGIPHTEESLRPF